VIAEGRLFGPMTRDDFQAWLEQLHMERRREAPSPDTRSPDRLSKEQRERFMAVAR